MSSRPRTSVRQVLESMGRLPKGATGAVDYIVLLEGHLTRIEACQHTDDLADLRRVRDGARQAIETASPVAQGNPAIGSLIVALKEALGPVEELLSRMAEEEPEAPPVGWTARGAEKPAAPRGANSRVQSATTDEPIYTEDLITGSRNSDEPHAFTPQEDEHPYAFAPNNLRGGTASTQVHSGTARQETEHPDEPIYTEDSMTGPRDSDEPYAFTPHEDEHPDAFAPNNLRGGTASTQARSGPMQQDQAPPTQNNPPPVDPVVAEFNRLWREVNNELDKRLPTLSDITAQDWKEQLVSAGNLTRQKSPDYHGACEALKNIKQALEKRAGEMDRESYDNVCEQFRATCEQSAPLVGDTALVQMNTFERTREDVTAGKVERAQAIPLIVRLEREVRSAHDTRLREILGVVADYERLEPIVARAEQSLDGPTAPPQSVKVKEAHGGFKAFIRRLPVIGQFFSKESGMHAPPPPAPRLSEVRKTVASGFAGAFQAEDLDSIRQQLGALETLAREALANIDIKAEIKKQEERLPLDATDLTKTKKKLGSGNFADTYVITGPETEVPKDPNRPEGPTVKKQQKFAGKVLKSTGPEAQQSIDKEVEAYARLGEHPNIAKCYGKQEIGGQTVLVMELVEGQSADVVFDDLLERYNKGELDRSEYMGAMQHIIHGILMGLSQFEALGLSHLDIKADNIRIDSNTHEPKILDMGLVQSQDVKLQTVKVPVKWVAPETLAKGEVGPTSDSFGLGQTIFQQLERGMLGQPKDTVGQSTRAWQRKERSWQFDVEGKRVKSLVDGPMFMPGTGVLNNGRDKGIKEFAQSGKNALNENGLPTAMPLTRASDQKVGNNPLAEGANPGKFGVETQYVDFMNRLMHPDPKKRMTPSEALRHPFMTERLMSKEELEKKVFPAKVEVQSSANDITLEQVAVVKQQPSARDAIVDTDSDNKVEVQSSAKDVTLDQVAVVKQQPPARDAIVDTDSDNEEPQPPVARTVNYVFSEEENDQYEKGPRQ